MYSGKLQAKPFDVYLADDPHMKKILPIFLAILSSAAHGQDTSNAKDTTQDRPWDLYHAIEARLDTVFDEDQSDRKKLELDVEAKKQLIEKYSLQQFQTKKNEEYRALAHEIEMCKEVIGKLDDQQLELMEQGEMAQREVAAQTRAFNEAKKALESRITDLGARETSLKTELAEIQANRGELADVVEDDVRSKYERLLRQKGSNVVVGIQHGVCGGCHMQLSRSTVVGCQADQEIVTCINCGRILYYTRDMDLAVAE